eukprot:scaffold15.g4355.t1
MPELPEVEGARRLVERTCVGKHILEATIAGDEKVFQGITAPELKAALEGRTVVAAKRRGKQMWIELDGGSPALLIHFGMTGGLVVQGIGAAHYKTFAIDDSTWPPRFWKFHLLLEGSLRLAFCDSRRFARVLFLSDPEAKPPISKLGWDPLLNMPPLEEFAAALSRVGRAIKALLLDQSFSAGIGNWICDEVLYQAAALHHQIRTVCETAAEVEADAERFPDTWLFHKRQLRADQSAAISWCADIPRPPFCPLLSTAIVPALQKLSKRASVVPAAPAAVEGGSAGAKAKGRGAKKVAAAANAAASAAVAVTEGAAVVAAGAAAAAVVATASDARPKPSRRGKKAATATGAADMPGAEAPAQVAPASTGTRSKKAVLQSSDAALAVVEAPVAASGKRRSTRAAAAVRAPASAKQPAGRSFRTGSSAAGVVADAGRGTGAAGGKRKAGAKAGAVKRARQ